MPLLDSFKIDHTKMPAPSVRLAKVMQTPNKDTICVFDLRFCRPNKEIISQEAIHTLEHLFAGFMRNHLNTKECEIIDISPMGCRTGFYMSVIGKPSYKDVITSWRLSMEDVLRVQKQEDIPELNIYQCGTCDMHSLQGAKHVAIDVLQKGISIANSEDLNLSV